VHEDILAEKGVTHETNPTSTHGIVGGGVAEPNTAAPAAKKEKVSLKDKIKAKLHKHKD